MKTLNPTLPFVQRRGVRPIAPRGYERVVDLFAGFGGASMGIEAADEWVVDMAVNHNRLAVDLHEINHPNTRHLQEDVYDVEPLDWFEPGEVGFLWASPDCTHFSLARGKRPKSKKIRSLANRVLHWARQVRPRVIMLENVREFQTWCRLDKRTGQPDFKRKGEYFHKFVRRLRQMGYTVDWRMINAADYGAPTARHRLFIIARCDGEKITWPKKTHGPRRKHPYRTAAEFIDFSLPCPSIFATSEEIKDQFGIRAVRPLADATMQRIARGVTKYVLEAKEPFIVRCGHYSNITGKGGAFRGQSINDPLATICSVNDKAVVVPSITGIDNRSAGNRAAWSGAEPLRTITQENRFAVTAAMLTKYHHAKAGESRCSRPDSPITTIDTQNRHGLVSALLIKNYTGVVGQQIDKPLGTITAKDHHSLVAAHIEVMHSASAGRAVNNPLSTAMGQVNHHALVASFLIKYNGTAIGQYLTEPMGTVTGRDRFGLVTVDLEDGTYVLADIGMRMLTPRELLGCQFGEFADNYVLDGTKTQQVAGIGNSVCPHVVRALVAANFSRRILAN